MTHVTVDLANPFTAGLKITGIKSSIKSMSLGLGTINTSTKFSSNGKSTTMSPDLDMNMNFDPVTLFTLTRALAVKAGESMAQLDSIVVLGG
ncbi:hypothetical protein PHLCEN_2v9644 [Hermanssonia centrifuga]|uniref:Uncharacterized protein n=1 Tax=Hermanssonia centrifuga TaxID=98765 RepID=A0A2R6NQ60_9APHY|nr:hypothetical protein PHLCEN_2v9644 [Hermanssonia centrifuga]